MTRWRDPIAVLLVPLVLPVWLYRAFLTYLFDRAFVARYPRGHKLNWRHPAAFVMLPFLLLAYVAAGIVFNPLTQRYIDSRRGHSRRMSR